MRKKIPKTAFLSLFIALVVVLQVFVFKAIKGDIFERVFALASTPGIPGDGYESDDPCGYIIGTSEDQESGGVASNTLNTGGNLVFDVGATYRNYRGCVDASGYFYNDYSNAWSNQVGWIDFGWTETEGVTTPSVTPPSTYLTNVDPITGEWSGYAWNEIVGWVQFDWSCSTTCDETNRVVTDVSTGDITGYAWNDQIGWISFYGLTQELAPYDISASVQVLSGDELLSAGEVAYADAPYADGAQYYRVKVVLSDSIRGNLTSADISELGMTINESGTVYLNQVKNEGSAVVESKKNPGISECSGLASTVYSCEMVDSGGETSFNYFIYSGAPTSNMLGIDESGDGTLDYYNDRAGGTDIYQSPTGDGLASSTRLEQFYDRQSTRNAYQIDSVDIVLGMVNTDADYSVNTSNLTDQGATTCNNGGTCEKYTWTPDSAYNLSWKPRFQGTSFVAYYDAAENDTIGGTTSTGMYLRSYATVAPVSDEFVTINGSSTGMTYSVHYEAASDAIAYDDSKFLIDSTTSVDSTMDARTRDNDFNRPSGSSTYYYGYGSTGQGYYGGVTPAYVKLRIGYGTDSTGDVSSTTTDPDNPTLEQWVCDSVVEGASGVSSPKNLIYYGNTANTGVKSCYFTGYLSREDAHADPENMDLIGAINSSIDESDLSDSDEISVLGAANYASLRNAMFAQVLRLVRNQTPSTSTSKSVCLDSSMAAASSISGHSSTACSTTLLSSLMSDTLLYTTEDVYIAGSTSFTDTTLVTNGGNVYIEGNIYGGRLGIIAFKNNGSGGNIYILPEVTDIYVNIFADGSVFSKDSTNASIASTVYPVWTSSDTRTADLWNQLYIFGSIVSRNTIGGATSDTAASPYNLGDGTTSSTLSVAKEYDLNALREFRLCYPLDADGNVDESGEPIDCDEGESRSEKYTENHPDAEVNNAPLIVEYNPPSSAMPVFNLSGLNLTNN